MGLAGNRVLQAVILATMIALPSVPFAQVPQDPPSESSLDEDALKAGSLGADEVRQLALDGDPEAQFRLGMMYARGVELDQDQREAAYWHRRAAEQGHAGAQTEYAIHLEQGRGVPKDAVQAVHWFRLAAEQGHGSGQTNLGFYYRGGMGGLPQDAGEAVRWFRRGAAQGEPDAMYFLAEAYAIGSGVPKDLSEAGWWWRKAAAIYRDRALRGHADSQARLGLIYLDGQGVPPDQVEAARWLRMAADQGVDEAQYRMAVFYDEGSGVAQDPLEALLWYKRAAEAGHLESQYILALAYARGVGVAQDHAAAAQWFRKAADRGHPAAHGWLGYLYAEGLGVPQDPAMAVQIYRLGMNLDDRSSAYGMAIAYADGVGIAQSEKDSARMLLIAFALDYPDAIEELRERRGIDWPEGVRRELQANLQEQGHYHGVIDGDLGSGTQAALDVFHEAAKPFREVNDELPTPGADTNLDELPAEDRTADLRDKLVARGCYPAESGTITPLNIHRSLLRFVHALRRAEEPLPTQLLSGRGSTITDGYLLRSAEWLDAIASHPEVDCLRRGELTESETIPVAPNDAPALAWLMRVATQDEGSQIGGLTGFDIGPCLVMTNLHGLEEAPPDSKLYYVDPERLDEMNAEAGELSYPDDLVELEVVLTAAGFEPEAGVMPLVMEGDIFDMVRHADLRERQDEEWQAWANAAGLNDLKRDMNGRWDWMILSRKDCSSPSTTYLQPIAGDLQAAGLVPDGFELYGFPGDLGVPPEAVYRTSPCHLAPDAATCSSWYGASGSPFMLSSPEGRGLFGAILWGGLPLGEAEGLSAPRHTQYVDVFLVMDQVIAAVETIEDRSDPRALQLIELADRWATHGPVGRGFFEFRAGHAPDAPLLEQYSLLQCGDCASFVEENFEDIEEATLDGRLNYRLILTPIGTPNLVGTLVTSCPLVGKSFDGMRTLFAQQERLAVLNQSGDKFQILQTIAEALDVPMQTARACIDLLNAAGLDTVADLIIEDLPEEGTFPLFFMDGQRVEREEVEAFLAR